MESKLKTGAKSRKNKNRKGFVGDKSRSETDGVLGVYHRNTEYSERERDPHGPLSPAPVWRHS